MCSCIASLHTPQASGIHRYLEGEPLVGTDGRLTSRKLNPPRQRGGLLGEGSHADVVQQMPRTSLGWGRRHGKPTSSWPGGTHQHSLLRHWFGSRPGNPRHSGMSQLSFHSAVFHRGLPHTPGIHRCLWDVGREEGSVGAPCPREGLRIPGIRPG